jgi:hypothetical protein
MLQEPVSVFPIQEMDETLGTWAASLHSRVAAGTILAKHEFDSAQRTPLVVNACTCISLIPGMAFYVKPISESRDQRASDTD